MQCVQEFTHVNPPQTPVPRYLTFDADEILSCGVPSALKSPPLKVTLLHKPMQGFSWAMMMCSRRESSSEERVYYVGGGCGIFTRSCSPFKVSLMNCKPYISRH